MLVSEIDKDRHYDQTILKAIPYLIFSSDEFKLRLSSLLFAFYHTYKSDDIAEFKKFNSKINELVDNYHMERFKKASAEGFTYRQMSIYKIVDDLKKHMIELDNKFKKLDVIERKLNKLEKTHSKKDNNTGIDNCNTCNESVISNESVTIQQYTENGKLIKEKVCPICTSTFHSNRTDAVYCSNKCRQTGYRKTKAKQ